MANSISLTYDFGFEWRIPNALSVDCLDSDEFIFDEHRWKLLWEIDTLSSSSDYLRINLRKKNPEKLMRIYKVRCFIKSRNDHLEFPVQSDLSRSGFDTEQVWGICLEDLERNISHYIKADGSLTVVIFFMSDNTGQKEVKKRGQTPVNRDMEYLRSDFANMLASGHLSDIQLQCEGHTISVHKNILCARSKVFKAMLETEMSENLSSCINIMDLDISTLRQLVQYLYTGKLTNLSTDTVHELYKAADKYDIEPLRKCCSDFLPSILSEENACEYLVWSDAYNDKELKDAVITFMVEKGVPLKVDIWSKFCEEHSKLALEVLNVAFVAKYSSRQNLSEKCELLIGNCSLLNLLDAAL